MEVLHHHTNKHVEDKEADNEEEGDEIQQHPWVVVGHRLELKRWFCSLCDIKERGEKENR